MHRFLSLVDEGDMAGSKSRMLVFAAAGLSLFAIAAGIVPARSLPANEAEARPVRLFIIDDDVGMLKREVLKDGIYQTPWFKYTDPDGGLELIYALREPSIKVLGISCAMGCSSTRVCMASVRKILELTGRTDVPLFKGAESPSDLGKPTPAARFIIDTVMQNPGEVEIMATAPLTNIATALMLEPRLAQNWKMLHMATGEFWGALGEMSDGAKFARVTGYQDMNINVDVKAVQYVLEHAGSNMVVYNNEIMDDAFLTMHHRRKLQKAKTPLAKWVADETFPITPVEKLFGGLPGMPLHGVVALAVAVDPSLAAPPQHIRIKLAQRKRGGYYFVSSDDLQVSSYPVFSQVLAPAAIEEQLVQRCQ